MGQLRAALLEAITPEKLSAVVQALIRQAETGNVPAIREVLDRAIGRPTLQIDLAADEYTPVIIRMPLAGPPDDTAGMMPPPEESE